MRQYSHDNHAGITFTIALLEILQMALQYSYPSTHRIMFSLLLLPFASQHAAAIAVSRRVALGSTAASATLSLPSMSCASTARDAVIAAVNSGASQETVEKLLEALVAEDPSGGRGADASGAWRLLWSARTSRFSPLLGLPGPIRPKSEQFLPEGGIQNTLSRGLLGPAEFVLSAGARKAEADTIEITPPFSFDINVAGQTYQILKAGSDAEFRRTQARSLDEQLAPRNRYKQLYLDTSGKKGDLRVSKVISGDPVVVGATFIHSRE